MKIRVIEKRNPPWIHTYIQRKYWFWPFWITTSDDYGNDVQTAIKHATNQLSSFLDRADRTYTKIHVIQSEQFRTHRTTRGI